MPKLKGEKELKPVSMRVKDAAEQLLTAIMDSVVSGRRWTQMDGGGWRWTA